MAVSRDWEALRSRAAALIAEREAVFAETAAAWVRFARARGWTRQDVEWLWEGLTEDLVRRAARHRGEAPSGIREEVLAVMAALRSRILEGLAPPKEGG